MNLRSISTLYFGLCGLITVLLANLWFFLIFHYRGFFDLGAICSVISGLLLGFFLAKFLSKTRRFLYTFLLGLMLGLLGVVLCTLLFSPALIISANVSGGDFFTLHGWIIILRFMVRGFMTTPLIFLALILYGGWIAPFMGIVSLYFFEKLIQKKSFRG